MFPVGRARDGRMRLAPSTTSPCWRRPSPIRAAALSVPGLSPTNIGEVKPVCRGGLAGVTRTLLSTRRESRVAKMTGDTYRRLAYWQDVVMEPLNGPLRDIGLRLVPPHKGMRVLDVGCGTGAQLARYQNARCAIAGIDTSPAMLQRARQRLGAEVELRQASAESLPYPAASFDLVIASMIFHELQPMVRDAVVAEMARVTAPGGRILVTEFHPGPWTFPKGWFYRGISVLAETIARHRDRSAAFLASGGMPALAGRLGLPLERTKVVAGGNVALYVLTAAALGTV
jgi:ubiquinone/menaquinone biosynthesis C-methylase UbiE